jgi:anti-anti-sigma factor
MRQEGVVAVTLTIRRTTGTRSMTFQLRGDLNLATAPDLAEAIDSVDDTYGRLVLDLSRLGSIDAEGVRALVRGKEELAKHGVKMDLSQVPRQAKTMFWRFRLEPERRDAARL